MWYFIWKEVKGGGCVWIGCRCFPRSWKTWREESFNVSPLRIITDNLPIPFSAPPYFTHQESDGNNRYALHCVVVLDQFCCWCGPDSRNSFHLPVIDGSLTRTSRIFPWKMIYLTLMQAFNVGCPNCAGHLSTANHFAISVSVKKVTW